MEIIDSVPVILAEKKIKVKYWKTLNEMTFLNPKSLKKTEKDVLV